MTPPTTKEGIIPSDLIAIVAQHLAATGYKRSLLDLSLASKDNFRLIALVLYRHLILTDKTAPKLFRYFLTFHKDVRFLFFASIDEDVDIASSSCHPIIRLRRYMTFVHKITVDTAYEEPKVFNVLAGWAKGLRDICQDRVFPNAQRLVLTARSGTQKHLRMVGMDDRNHGLATFLPLACEPQYICYTPPPPLPRPRRIIPGFGDGAAAYTVVFDDGIAPVWAYQWKRQQEIVNLHQAASIMYPNRANTRCRVSFAAPGCFFGDAKCEDSHHPTHCKKSDMEIKMSKLVGTSFRTRPEKTVITLEDMTKGQMTIVDRDGQASSFKNKLDEIIDSTVQVVFRPPLLSSEQLTFSMSPQDVLKKLREAITITNDNTPCEACGGPI
ncbi:hypothetical protein IAT40_001687 [Kwoniella sp. CBS 6097]